MPVQFRIDVEAGLVITEVEEPVAEQELLCHVQRLAQMSDGPLRALADFSSMDRIPMSAEAMRNAAWQLHEARADQTGSKLALVGRSDAVFAMLRLFQAYRAGGGMQIRVFRERSRADEWLSGLESVVDPETDGAELPDHPLPPDQVRGNG